jgi:hypothetical protein
MRFSTERLAAADGAVHVAPDWESLGCLVRIGTLDAVAMHFANVGSRELLEDESPRGLKPAARVGVT